MHSIKADRNSHRRRCCCCLCCCRCQNSLTQNKNRCDYGSKCFFCPFLAYYTFFCLWILRRYMGSSPSSTRNHKRLHVGFNRFNLGIYTEPGKRGSLEKSHYKSRNGQKKNVYDEESRSEKRSDWLVFVFASVFNVKLTSILKNNYFKNNIKYFLVTLSHSESDHLINVFVCVNAYLFCIVFGYR